MMARSMLIHVVLELLLQGSDIQIGHETAMHNKYVILSYNIIVRILL